MSFLDKIFAGYKRLGLEIAEGLNYFVGKVVEALENSLQRIGAGFVDLFWEIAQYLHEKTERPYVEWKRKTGNDIYREMIEAGADEDASRDMADEFVDATLLNAPLTLIMTWALFLILPIKRRLTALSPWLTYWANRKYRATLHAPADAILIHRRNEAETREGLKLDYDLLAELGNQGFSPDRISGLLAASYNPIPWPDVLRLHAGGMIDDDLLTRFAAWHNVDDVSLEQVPLWEHRPLDFNTVLPFLWRGIHDHEQALTELQIAGYNPEQAEGLLELSELIPAPPDLVRMAVREVFTPEIAKEFGQFEGLPPDFVDWMSRQGYSEMWAKYYWGAHWDLPSVQMGFQMLHRDEIKMPKLDFLLRALDIMPAWREPIKAIAYRLLTRVDVRRMHKTGVLSLDGVHKAYRYLGYKPDDADLMTAFTAEYNAQGDRDLSKSEILKAYKTRILSLDDTADMLLELGYDVDSTAVLMYQVDLDRHNAAKSTKTKHIQGLFDAHIIERAEAVVRLTELPTDGNEALELVSIWADERALKETAELVPDSLPTRADLTAFIKAGVMGRYGWTQVMTWRKYAPQFIRVYWETLPDEVRQLGEDYDRDNAELPDETGQGRQG